MGHGWPFETTLGAAPERGKSSQSEDPDARVCFFCLLCFAQAKKSEAPGGAQQNHQSTTIISLAQSRENHRIANP